MRRYSYHSIYILLTVVTVRETVKTISLEQDPPYHKKRWWSLSVPSIPHLQRWCLGCKAPHSIGS